MKMNILDKIVIDELKLAYKEDKKGLFENYCKFKKINNCTFEEILNDDEYKNVVKYLFSKCYYNNYMDGKIMKIEYDANEVLKAIKEFKDSLKYKQVKDDLTDEQWLKRIENGNMWSKATEDNVEELFGDDAFISDDDPESDEHVLLGDMDWDGFIRRNGKIVGFFVDRDAHYEYIGSDRKLNNLEEAEAFAKTLSYDRIPLIEQIKNIFKNSGFSIIDNDRYYKVEKI